MSWNHYDIIYTEVSIRYNMYHLSNHYLLCYHCFHPSSSLWSFSKVHDNTRNDTILRHPAKLVHFFHLTQSTQHAARFTLKVRYKDLFLVFFFFSFLWNLEISPSKFSVKAHNISKYISQYFQIQLYNNEICKIASPSSPLPPPLPQLR